MRPRCLALVTILLTTQVALAQTCDQIGNPNGTEGRVHSDLCREWFELHPCSQQLIEPCSEFTFGHLSSIGQTLVTGQPLHIALGSLAPQNGFAAGLAFVEHKDFANEWRLTTDTDAVASTNSSWRAGSYLTAYRLPQSHSVIGVVMGTPIAKQKQPSVQIAPVFNLYAEATSLNRLSYFYGLGPNTIPTGQSAFGLTQTIAGVSAILSTATATASPSPPSSTAASPQLRGDSSETVPPLASSTRKRPPPASLVPHHSSSPASHSNTAKPLRKPRASSLPRELPGLHQSRPAPATLFAAGPPTSVRSSRSTARASPPPTPTTVPTPAHPTPLPARTSPPRSTTRAPSASGYSSPAHRDASNAVPVLNFDPTTGGSNIDGNPILASYPDYRVRSPNLVLLAAPSNTPCPNFHSASTSPPTPQNPRSPAATSTSPTCVKATR